MLVTKKKKFFEKFDTHIKQPPYLNIQVWDNDALSADDFLGNSSFIVLLKLITHVKSMFYFSLGSVTINLSNFKEPATSASKCTIKNYNKSDSIDLLHVGKWRGWYPLRGITKSNIIEQTV